MKKEEQLAPSLDPDSLAGAGSCEPEIQNENHRLQLRYTFQCIDSVLTEIEQILADPERKSGCATLNLTKSVLLIALTAAMTKQQVHRHVSRQVGYELRNFLNAYARQLRSWYREAINNIRSALFRRPAFIASIWSRWMPIYYRIERRSRWILNN